MLIHEMSSIYTYQFALAAEGGTGADYAFRVIERARGRVLSEMITLGRPCDPRHRLQKRRRLDQDVNRYSGLCSPWTGPALREATLRRIWEVQQKMVSAPNVPLVFRWKPSLLDFPDSSQSRFRSAGLSKVSRVRCRRLTSWSSRRRSGDDGADRTDGPSVIISDNHSPPCTLNYSEGIIGAGAPSAASAN